MVHNSGHQDEGHGFFFFFFFLRLVDLPFKVFSPCTSKLFPVMLLILDQSCFARWIFSTVSKLWGFDLKFHIRRGLVVKADYVRVVQVVHIPRFGIL